MSTDVSCFATVKFINQSFCISIAATYRNYIHETVKINEHLLLQQNLFYHHQAGCRRCALAIFDKILVETQKPPLLGVDFLLLLNSPTRA
jgi:hypothetical protein